MPSEKVVKPTRTTREDDHPLLQTANFLENDPDYEFSMNVIYREVGTGDEQKIVGCMIGAALVVYRKELTERYGLPINDFPIKGYAYDDVVQELWGLTDEQMEELCFPKEFDYASVTVEEAVQALRQMHAKGTVDWEEI